MFGDERDPDACVRLNHVEHHLGADVLQQILNVVADERVIIDGAPAFTKKFSSNCQPTNFNKVTGWKLAHKWGGDKSAC